MRKGRPPLIRHEDWLDANEALEWTNLMVAATRLDAERRQATMALNLLRQRAAQRALAARRRQTANA